MDSGEGGGGARTAEPIGLGEKIGYGLGDAASNLYFQFFNLFLFYYYTDVFGLDPTAVGTMYLVANLWDAVNDPLMGALADRTTTRFGRYRPYLLWFAVPYGLTGYLIFASPELGETGKLAFAYGTFIGFKMVYTAINVPYSALLGVMTDDAKDRVALSTARFLGAFGGGFLVSLLVRPLVRLFGDGDELLGFQSTMAVFGALSVVLFLATFVSTKERLAPKLESVDLRTDLGFLLRNSPWLVMIAAAVCTLAAVAVRGAVTVHYFKYVVGAGDEAVLTLGFPSTAFFLELDLATVFLSSGMLAFIAGVGLTGFVSARLGKRNGLIAMTLANAACVIAFFFVPPDQIALMMVLNLLGNLFAGPTPALVWALYTDVADYGEWRFGRRATGLVFAAAMFAQKLGLTLGGAGSGWMLGLFGFVAHQPQSDSAILGLRVLFSLLPGALAVANGLVLLLYPLGEEETERLRAELATRRAPA